MSRASLSGALRTAGVLTLGALGLHQLTYLLANGSDAGHALTAQGHSYLFTLAPALVSVAVGVLLATLALSTAGPARRARAAACRSVEARGAMLAVAFLAVFGIQEVVEGALIASHPHGLAALAECWVALPLALPIGALAALVLGGLERADRLIAAVRSRQRLPRAPRKIRFPRPRWDDGLALSCRALAFGLARRGPPVSARVL
jgi:hypothetical protein